MQVGMQGCREGGAGEGGRDGGREWGRGGRQEGRERGREGGRQGGREFSLNVLRRVLYALPSFFCQLLLLLYGYYQSRFGLILRSRGGRWGLIKATVCSNILQMFVRY